MKQRAFFLIFALVGMTVAAQQNDDMYKKARLVLYGKNPVEKANQLSDAEVFNFRWYGYYCIGMHDGSGENGDLPNFDGTKKLAKDDGEALLFLMGLELSYREREDDDEFLLSLQDRRENLSSMYSPELSSKLSNWLYFYEWKIK